jgi:hypothetical protein
VAAINGVIGFKRGRRGVIVASYLSRQDFLKGAVAGSIVGPSVGDCYVDSELRIHTLTRIRHPQVGLLARIRSLISPVALDLDADSEASGPVAFTEIQERILAALGGRPAQEYLSETGDGVANRAQNIRQAQTFGQLIRALRSQ